MILILTAFAAGHAERIVYPETVQSDQVDDYFGTEVPDPYRWLEDVDSDETLEWIAAQNELWSSYLEEIPVRNWVLERLEELFDYEYSSMPYKTGDLYFFSRNDGLQDHAVFCCAENLEDEPRVLIDPNGFPPEERLSLAGTSVSDDGKLLAWATSGSGSDWTTWYVMDIETGEALEDTVLWTKGYVSWNPDNTGFYYSRYDEPEAGEEYTEINEIESVYFHRLGTAQDLDSLVYSRPDRPEWMLGAYTTEDGRFLIIWVWDASSVDRNGIFYIDLQSENRQVVELLNDFYATYSLIGNIGEDFYFRTDLDANNGRIICIDIASPERENWREIVPESEEILGSASILNNSESLVLQYSWDAYDKVYFYDIEGNFQNELQLPAVGTVYGFGGYQTDTETFYKFSSNLHPGEIFRYDFNSGESTFFWEPEIDADLTAFEEKQVFYESHDGTMIPMFLIYPKGIELDGSNPTILYGYGGFGVSMSPWFSTSRIVWLEMGGIYAIPCIRGGNEYGEEWHLAGIKENRPVVFGDFISAAEYLIEEGYTSAPKLAISGASNGGTLVGACLNMRPDLFGAAAPAMGVMDLLRFHLFTIGWAWTSEYGDPDDPEEFGFILNYSPYHNIEPGIEYPSVLVSTADHDDRVVPGHSFKYAARLQAAQSGDAPVLISITSRSGHGGAVGLLESLQQTADLYAFFWQELGMGD
jgi:prolyl oligopeptidase